MEHFWPTLPYIIPTSQGLPLWWSILWWIFQIAIMSTLLWIVTRWALRVDRELNLDGKTKPHEKKKTTDGGRSIDV
jgi:hypothetical protein